jgi:hypothetical protein
MANKLIYSTKEKLVQNHLLITKSDKGNGLVTLHEDNYKNYIEDYFVNHFT